VETARIRARIERQYVVLQVSDDLDAEGARALAGQLDQLNPCTDVVLDMSAVHRCSDEGWQLLSQATERVDAADGSLTLSRVNPDVRAALRASGYAGRLKIRRRGR